MYCWFVCLTFAYISFLLTIPTVAVTCAKSGCTLESLGCTPEIFRLEQSVSDCSSLNISGPVHILNYPNETSSISFQNNQITSFSATEFDAMPSLEYIILKNNTLKALSPEQFAKNTRLKNIQLSDNNLETLSPEQFAKNTRLESIDLTNNRLETLSPGLFLHNAGLEYLYLGAQAYNCNVNPGYPSSDPKYCFQACHGLHNLDRNQFAGNPFLFTLDLSDNALSYLPAGLFRKNKKLGTLLLSYSFRNRSVWGTIYTFDDEFCGGSSLKNIIGPDVFPTSSYKLNLKLDLSHNSLDYVDPKAFLHIGGRSKLHLDLSHNKLNETNEELFKNIEHEYVFLYRYVSMSCSLEVLNLRAAFANSQIYLFRKKNVLSGNLFKFNPCLTTVDLVDNVIESVPRDIFYYNTKLSQLLLVDETSLSDRRNPIASPVDCSATDVYIKGEELEDHPRNYRTLVNIRGTYFYACDECTRPDNAGSSLSFTCWENSIDDVYSHHPPYVCPAGSWCNTTTLSEHKCPPNTYNPLRGSSNPTECLKCKANSYNPFFGQISCPYQCIGRKLITATHSNANNQLQIADSNLCDDCKPGYYAESIFVCKICPTGYYQNDVNQPTCKYCGSSGSSGVGSGGSGGSNDPPQKTLCNVVPGQQLLNPSSIRPSVLGNNTIEFPMNQTWDFSMLPTKEIVIEYTEKHVGESYGQEDQITLIPPATATIIYSVLAGLAIMLVLLHRW